MPLHYMITAKWEKDQADWYIPLKVEIENMTDENVNSPEISFDISKIANISGEVRAYTGFAQQTVTPPIIKGKLSAELATLKAKSTTTLTFGVNFSNISAYPSLPTDFTFNGEPIVIPEDHTPPTKVEDIVTAASGPNGFALNWKPSTDDVGVKEYIVKYRATHETQDHTATTKNNNISLTKLAPDTKYQVNITAVDYAGNTSASSSYYAFTDKPLEGPAPLTDFASSEFLDTTSWPTPKADEWAAKTKLQGYYLGFITGALGVDGKVKACWGGTTSMYDGNDGQTYDGDATISGYYKAYINNIRANGGEVVLSFGGASNEPIEGGIHGTRSHKVVNNPKM